MVGKTLDNRYKLEKKIGSGAWQMSIWLPIYYLIG